MRKYILYFLIASVSFLQAGINEDLLQGAMEGNTALVKRSIEQRAELETKNEEGETALILAAWYGSPEIVILLLENGANVNAQDKLGFTAIAKASSLGVGRHYEIVELLIQASANVNLKTKDGRSPFILAIINGHRELSNVLKRAGAKDEPYFTGEETNLELLAAARLGNLNRVQYVMFFKPNINANDDLGMNSLMYSARNGNREINILLKRVFKEKLTLSFEIDEPFLINIDIEDNSKYTAITWAEKFSQKEIADFLRRLSDK